MIDRIKLKFGSSIGEKKLDIQLTPITIFVGPNNSGKSKIIKEINNFCKAGKYNNNDVLIDKMELNKVDSTF